MSLAGRKILLTGAARGIGRALSRQLVGAGANVVAIGRDGDALARLAAEHPGSITPWRLDLAQRSDVEHLVAAAPREHPDLSVVINNAGIQVLADFLDEGDRTEALRAEIAVNLEAVVAICSGLLPHLAAQPAAALVNVTSGLALAPKASAPVYCATKAGVRSLTKALRYQCEDGAPHVAVVEVIMALVDTDMTAGRGARKITPEQAATGIVDGLRRGDREIWIDRARLLGWLMRVAPGVGERLMRNG